jgi:hypothetical protein
VLSQAQNQFQPTVPNVNNPLTGGTVVGNSGQSLLSRSVLSK